MDRSDTATPLLHRALCLGAFLTPLNIWLGITIGQFALRPLQVWALLFIPLVLATHADDFIRAFDATTLVFVSLVAALTTSTIFATPVGYRLRAAADLGLLFLNVAAFAAVHGGLRDRPAATRDFLRWLAMGALVNAVLLGIRSLSLSRQTLLASADSNVFGLGTVVGTFESAIAAAATLAMIFAPDRRSARAAGVLLLANGGLAVLSLARGPWLAATGAVLLVIPVGAWQLRHQLSPRRLLLRLSLPAGVLVTAVAALAATNLTRLLLIVNRILALSEAARPVSSGGTAYQRLQIWTAMIDDTQRSLLFGNGAATYREISEYLMIVGQVSENFVVEIAHAGGLLSLLLLVIGVGLCLGVSLKQESSPTLESVMIRMAVLAGAATVVLGSLTNPSAWNGMYWVVLALAASPYRPRTT
jgi:hypothetical protein